MIDKHKTNLIELEIQTLLTHHQDLEFVIDALIKKYDDENLNPAQIELICQFLLAAGFYSPLLTFLMERIEANKAFPMAYYAEVLRLSGKAIPEEIKEALLQGAHDLHQLEDLARSELLSDEKIIAELRDTHRQRLKDQLRSLREELALEIEVLSSQKMWEEKGKKIEQALKMFPEDSEFIQLSYELNADRAHHFIQEDSKKKPRHIPLEIYQSIDPATQSALEQVEISMLEALSEKGWPEELAKDFAIAQSTWQNDNAALGFIKKGGWLKAEILLKARRYVELLEELDRLEINHAHDPDSTPAIIYMKAQAFWGLGQKNRAISLMESLLKALPDYRSTATLLAEWKSSQ